MTPYTAALRKKVESILAGLQKLEELDVLASDDSFAHAEKALDEADAALWETADWVAEGRPDEPSGGSPNRKG